MSGARIMARAVILIAGCVAVSGCGKPAFTERKAPPGVFYLREGLSMTNEVGVRRVIAGTEMVYVSGEGNAFILRAPDGGIWEAKPEQLTDDLDVRDRILERREGAHRIVAEKSAKAREMEAAREKETFRLSTESAKERTEQRIARARADLAALGARIAAAEREIEEKRIVPVQARSGIGAGYSTTMTRTRTIAALSPDASQIENLRSTYRAMESQLRQLETNAK